jgi:hypothetical protein
LGRLGIDEFKPGLFDLLKVYGARLVFLDPAQVNSVDAVRHNE